MMGRRRGNQSRLFYEFYLDDRVPKSQLLRHIDVFVAIVQNLKTMALRLLRPPSLAPACA